MIDKRRWPRVNCEWEAVYRSILRPSGAIGTSVTVDLSEGGVRFRTNTFIAVGDRLRFTLRRPKSASLESILTSVWVREIPTFSVFEIGGSFEDISREGQRSLREWTDAKQAILVTRVPESVF